MIRLLTRLWRSSTQRVMSLGGVGMVLALLADVLIIRRFGFTAVTDAIVVALTMPRLIGTVGRDATKFSLMTVFIQIEKEEGPEAFADLGVRVFNLFLGIGFVLMMAGLLLAGPIVSVVGWGLEPQGQALAATLLRLASGIAVFALGSAVLEVMLNSHKHFTVTALRNAVVPFVVIVTTLATWRIEQAPYWIAGAYTAGYAIYYLMLMINATGKLGFKPDPTRLPNRQTFTKLRGTIGYPLTGFGVRQMARVAERTIASLGPTGSVTAYYCAYRLLAAIQNIVGVSVALTGLPKLAAHDLADESEHFNRVMRQRVGLILVIAVPAAAFLMLLSRPIIVLLYGGGGMNPTAINASASVLFVLGFATIFYCLIPVLNSALYARKRYGTVLCNMCFAAGTNVLLAFVLFNWLGLTGVAWAAMIAAMLSVLNLLRLNARSVSLSKPEPAS